MQDGMLCDRCGDIATHFHEDYGNVCPTCAVHWSNRDEERHPVCSRSIVDVAKAAIAKAEGEQF